MIKTTAKNLVDIDQENKIMQAAADESNAKWVIGDEVNKSKEKALITKVPIIEIYAYVADLAGFGSWETVRKRAELSAFYPVSMRDDYPMLYASHFRAAMRVGDLQIAMQWLSVAQSSADDYNGKPMPVRVLQARISAAIAAGLITPTALSEDPFEILLQTMRWRVKSFRQSFEDLLDQCNASGSESLLMIADNIAEGIEMIEAEFEVFEIEKLALELKTVFCSCSEYMINHDHVCVSCGKPIEEMEAQQ